MRPSKKHLVLQSKNSSPCNKDKFYLIFCYGSGLAIAIAAHQLFSSVKRVYAGLDHGSLIAFLSHDTIG